MIHNRNSNMSSIFISLRVVRISHFRLIVQYLKLSSHLQIIMKNSTFTRAFVELTITIISCNVSTMAFIDEPLEIFNCSFNSSYIRQKFFKNQSLISLHLNFVLRKLMRYTNKMDFSLGLDRQYLSNKEYQQAIFVANFGKQQNH